MAISVCVLKCEQCGCDFERRVSEAERAKRSGWKIFCGPACRSEYKHSNKKERTPPKYKRMPLVEVTCEVCGDTFLRRAAEVRRNEKKGRRIYCGLSCAGKANNKHLAAYVEENTKRILLVNRKATDEYSPFRYHLKNARSHAKQKNRLVTVTLQDLKEQWEKQNGVCPYTGWKLDPRTKVNDSGRHMRRASLDRIDSNRGYEPGNIQFVAWIANVAKCDFQDCELFEFCKAVTEYRS